jgi:hypothetical protein
MCFSLTASATTSALLTVIGIAALRKSTQTTRLIAMIPLLFAIQQASEAVIWFAKLHPVYAGLEKPCGYFFLSFAFFVWPVWNTLSLLKLETNPQRKKYIRLCLIPAALFMGFIIFEAFKNSLQVLEVDHHIVYMTATPMSFLALFVYCLATVLPLFLSSFKEFWIMGMLILASLGFTLYRWYNVFGSIWCFFAAILSIYVYFIIDKLNDAHKSTWPHFISHFFK